MMKLKTRDQLVVTVQEWVHKSIRQDMEINELRAKLARCNASSSELLISLKIIMGNSCTNYTHPRYGACMQNHERFRDGMYEAESWCNSCIAYDVITRVGSAFEGE